MLSIACSYWYLWLEWTCCAPIVCYSKPRRHFTVSFLPTVHVMGFVSNRSNTVQLTRLRFDLLACFAQCNFGDSKYMIIRQSHGFSYNNCTNGRHKLHSLSLVQLLSLFLVPNCTWIHVITYTRSLVIIVISLPGVWSFYTLVSGVGRDITII